MDEIQELNFFNIEKDKVSDICNMLAMKCDRHAHAVAAMIPPNPNKSIISPLIKKITELAKQLRKMEIVCLLQKDGQFDPQVDLKLLFEKLKKIKKNDKNRDLDRYKRLWENDKKYKDDIEELRVMDKKIHKYLKTIIEQLVNFFTKMRNEIIRLAAKEKEIRILLNKAIANLKVAKKTLNDTRIKIDIKEKYLSSIKVKLQEYEDIIVAKKDRHEKIQKQIIELAPLIVKARENLKNDTIQILENSDIEFTDQERKEIIDSISDNLEDAVSVIDRIYNDKISEGTIKPDEFNKELERNKKHLISDLDNLENVLDNLRKTVDNIGDAVDNLENIKNSKNNLKSKFIALKQKLREGNPNATMICEQKESIKVFEIEDENIFKVLKQTKSSMIFMKEREAVDEGEIKELKIEEKKQEEEVQKLGMEIKEHIKELEVVKKEKEKIGSYIKSVEENDIGMDIKKIAKKDEEQNDDDDDDDDDDDEFTILKNN